MCFVIAQYPFQMVPQFLSGELPLPIVKNLVILEIQMAPFPTLDTQEDFRRWHPFDSSLFAQYSVRQAHLFLVIWTSNLGQVTENDKMVEVVFNPIAAPWLFL